MQLKHSPKETSWEDRDHHGFVCIADAAGVELFRKGGFQHNVNLRNGGAFDPAAIEALVDSVKKMPAVAAAAA